MKALEARFGLVCGRFRRLAVFLRELLRHLAHYPRVGKRLVFIVVQAPAAVEPVGVAVDQVGLAQVDRQLTM